MTNYDEKISFKGGLGAIALTAMFLISIVLLVAEFIIPGLATISLITILSMAFLSSFIGGK